MSQRRWSSSGVLNLVGTVCDDPLNGHHTNPRVFARYFQALDMRYSDINRVTNKQTKTSAVCPADSQTSPQMTYALPKCASQKPKTSLPHHLQTSISVLTRRFHYLHHIHGWTDTLSLDVVFMSNLHCLLIEDFKKTSFDTPHRTTCTIILVFPE